MTFINQERTGPTLRGEVSIPGRKLLADGRVSLSLALGSRKWGDELIAQVFSKGTPRIESRKSDEWNRVAVYLGPLDLETAEVLERIAADIRERLEEKQAERRPPEFEAEYLPGG